MDREEMSVDELARAAGTTTRNVRAYQTRGLLPPPRLAGRVGYYSQAHLSRLRLIARLQERGFSLASVAELLRAWESGANLADVLGFEEALAAPWSDEAAIRLSRAELAELFPGGAEDPALLERAIRLGLVREEGEQLVVPSPALLRMGSDLVALGIPLQAVLDIAAELRADARRTADRFVDLFRRHVWQPFVEEGMPPERLPEVTDALRRLRPMASAAVLATLAAAMEEAVASATAEEARRTAEGTPAAS